MEIRNEAKQKAEELVNKYMNIGQVKMSDYSRIYLPTAKVCALIAVDEILNNNCGSHTDESNASNSEIYCDEYYWMEVKTEIGSI